MKRLLQSKIWMLIVPILVFLSGCANFSGIRTPKYDGAPIQPNKEAIELFAERHQINEENEAHYFRYPLSDTLFEPSLDFSDEETILLEAGTYRVGEDLPEGRVVLQGHPSNYSAEVFLIYAGNVTVYDATNVVAFENHFQERSGVMQVVVDLREGQTVEVEGEDPRINVHYSEEAASQFQPQSDDPDRVILIGGHYEVGQHLEQGIYTIGTAFGPRTPVLYHFSDGEITVVELTQNRGGIPPFSREENEEMFEFGTISEEEYKSNLKRFENQPDGPIIELKAGDKVYLPMLEQMELHKH